MSYSSTDAQHIVAQRSSGNRCLSFLAESQPEDKDATYRNFTCSIPWDKQFFVGAYLKIVGTPTIGKPGDGTVSFVTPDLEGTAVSRVLSQV
jgi:hypothetical protein